MSLINLLDLLPAELESLAESLSAPRYRGRQIASWIYAKGAADIAAMSDLPKEFRQRLAEQAEVALPEVERRTPSQDGSEKLVLRLSDSARIQAVLMPDADRLTLCVSTQVGCGFGCAFCFTGTMGVERNLTAGEIVGQVTAARAGLPAGSRLTHIVYMGMGEPLANYAATVKSIRILTDPRGLALAPRRITVSTVGLVSGIERLAKENLRVNLAISLHATSNEIRDRIMPVNKGFAIEELLQACRRFPVAFRQRITFEYVLLEGVNDGAEDARRLVRLLKGIRAKINLIPFNDWEGSGFQRPPLQRILGFQAILLEHGIRATVRWSKGEDIGAACGQLKETVSV
ncbi:MAG TPA: 23S rRNA (adenine(2503)-C(2))-methyltransferase RlmN [Methylomirabilota bacterium]|nr:23S rRNA (adenine(2503)-C(2))-methyltransferase RlmN [Methylomirabilota bacterium]